MTSWWLPPWHLASLAARSQSRVRGGKISSTSFTPSQFSLLHPQLVMSGCPWTILISLEMESLGIRSYAYFPKILKTAINFDNFSWKYLLIIYYRRLVNPKENQPWIFIGRTDAEAEAPILQPCDAKSQLIGKEPNTGKDWSQKEKGAAGDEMVR